MIALACEQPKERPISHWTGREIANEVVARGIVAQISPRLLWSNRASAR
jgi:putative transposase